MVSGRLTALVAANAERKTYLPKRDFELLRLNEVETATAFGGAFMPLTYHLKHERIAAYI